MYVFETRCCSCELLLNLRQTRTPCCCCSTWEGWGVVYLAWPREQLVDLTNPQARNGW